MSSANGLMQGAVRLVILQFSFSNLKLIPTCIPQRAKETTEGFVARKSAIRGEQIVQETHGVSVLSFLLSLVSYGYQLVDAFSIIRTKDGRDYRAVRFTFASPGHHECSPEFAKIRPAILQELRKMLGDAMWRVRGYLNPFFANQEVLDGVFVISINLEARDPLVEPDGKPILRYMRDEQGNKIGEKVPVQPKCLLKIENGDVVVVAK